MKRNLILAFVLLVSCITVEATTTTPDDNKAGNKSKVEANSTVKKTWEFYSAIKKLTAEDLANEARYKFGQEAGCLYTLFMSTYIVREEVVPGDPTRRTLIRKPAIYNAVRTIEKQLGKELKTNGISKEQAATEFANVLKIALSAIDSDSQSFEDALQANRKDATNLLSVFNSVKLTEI